MEEEKIFVKVRKKIKSSGYRAAFPTNSIVNYENSDIYKLGRIEILKDQY